MTGSVQLPLVLEAGTALWVDAAGTLLHPREPVPEVYAAYARRHGVDVDAKEVGARLRPAMRRHAPLRDGDPSWRRYWAAVVTDALGTDAPFEGLYSHYAGAAAWRVAEGAPHVLAALRERGVRIALVSNWDVRLRLTLDELGLASLFDALIISAEVGVDKPQAEIFMRAAQRLGVPPGRSLMIGDDPENDVRGARSAGAFVMQFGNEIKAFSSIMDS